MKNLTDYIHRYDDVLSAQLCKSIINKSRWHDFVKANTVGESNSRKCYIKAINQEFDKDIFKSVGQIIEKYAKAHKHFSTGLTCEDTGYQHLIYLGSQKGEYKEHTDHGDITPRVLTISFILNDSYDGGDFVFFGGTYTVPKKQGSVVVFPSNFCFPHAITPVTNGDRHAIITWVH